MKDYMTLLRENISISISVLTLRLSSNFFIFLKAAGILAFLMIVNKRLKEPHTVIEEPRPAQRQKIDQITINFLVLCFKNE